MTDFVAPPRPSPPTTVSAPAAARAMPATFIAVTRSSLKTIAAASVKTGTAVMRIAAACADVSASPPRNIVWLMTTPSRE